MRAQARTTNDTYILNSSDFRKRNKVIELIHPEGRVVGTMSPISCVFVPAEMLSPCVPSITRAANSLSRFWEPLQCSNNPPLLWLGGNIVSEFPAPRLLQHSVASAFINPWTALLTHAALQAFAASLLDQDYALLSMLQGMMLSGANCWRRPPAHPLSPAASQPLVKELWPAPSKCRRHWDRNGKLVSSNAWRLPSKTVQESETSTVQKKSGGKTKYCKISNIVLGTQQSFHFLQAMGHEELFKI